MNENQHTVTIPIADYNELMSTKEFVGLEKISRDSSMFKEMEAFMYQRQRGMGLDEMSGNPLKNVELYIKTI